MTEIDEAAIAWMALDELTIWKFKLAGVSPLDGVMAMV